MEDRLAYLLERVRQKLATDADYQELLRLIRADENGSAGDAIHSFYRLPGDALEPYSPEEMDSLFAAVLTSGRNAIADPDAPVAPFRPVRRMVRWWAAASIVLLLGTGAYLRLQQLRTDGGGGLEKPGSAADIAPGGSGAILTLADGSQVVLDSLRNGEVAQQAGAKVLLQNGKLAYESAVESAVAASGEREMNKLAYNTMTTPRGRQFQVALPDGTTVWLNAASSIRYPTVFGGPERKVEITGEVYFEVAKDVKRPFRVRVNQTTEVEVLGTQFNVNAYSDEASIHTTLLEGSVKVVAGSRTRILHPGEQAQSGAAGVGIQLVKNVDTEQVVAWKEGAFSFSGADLPTVMRQLSRWYDVDVEYEGAIPAGEFTGKIDHSLTLSQLLKGLAGTINYRIENGNKIIIYPNTDPPKRGFSK